MKIAILLVALTIWTTRTALGKDSETLDAAGGQKVVKEYYETGVIKIIRRYDATGKLIGILYHDTKGVPLRADLYDGDKIAGKIYYHPNGNPRLAEHCDANGVTRSAQEFDTNNKLLSTKTYDAKGNLLKEDRSLN